MNYELKQYVGELERYVGEVKYLRDRVTQLERGCSYMEQTITELKNAKDHLIMEIDDDNRKLSFR